MAGFLAAAGLIGGAASAAGHGLADSHKRAGDVGGADVIFQTATADTDGKFTSNGVQVDDHGHGGVKSGDNWTQGTK